MWGRFNNFASNSGEYPLHGAGGFDGPWQTPGYGMYQQPSSPMERPIRSPCRRRGLTGGSAFLDPQSMPSGSGGFNADFLDHARQSRFNNMSSMPGHEQASRIDFGRPMQEASQQSPPRDNYQPGRFGRSYPGSGMNEDAGMFPRGGFQPGFAGGAQMHPGFGGGFGGPRIQSIGQIGGGWSMPPAFGRFPGGTRRQRAAMLRGGGFHPGIHAPLFGRPNLGGFPGAGFEPHPSFGELRGFF